MKWLSQLWVAASFLTPFLVATASVADEPDKDKDKEWIWHDRWVTNIALGNEGTLFASLATSMPHREGSVVQFSTDNPDDAKILYKHPAAVWAAAVSPDKSTLASADFHGTLALTNIATNETKQYEKAFVRWTRAIAFSADSKHLIAGNEAGTLFAWSVVEGKLSTSRELGSGQIMSIAIHPSGESLAVATGSGKLQIVKWPSLESIKEVNLGDKPLWSVAVNASGDLIWVGGSDGTVKRVSKEGEAKEIAKLNDWVTSLATLPGGGLAAVSMRGQIKRSSKADPTSLVEWANGPKGIWDVKAIDADRLIVATQKLGPTTMQSVGQVQYIAKDAATKAAERKAAAEKAAKEKEEAEKREADRLLAEKLAAERKAAADKAAADKAAADKAAADKAAADKAAAEKAAAEKAATDKAAAEKEKPAEKPAEKPNDK